MKRLALASLLAIAMGHYSIACAQDSLVGTYKGNNTGPGCPGDVQVEVQLVIASVEKGVVKGTVTQFSKGGCAGEYPMEGTYDDNKLVMKSTGKGGRAGDCDFGLNVALEGNKLVGTNVGGRPIQLSK